MADENWHSLIVTLKDGGLAFVETRFRWANGEPVVEFGPLPDDVAAEWEIRQCVMPFLCPRKAD